MVDEDAPTRFDFPEPAPIAPPMLTLDRVAVGYGGAPVLRASRAGSTSTTASPCWGQRQRQIDLRQAAGGAAGAASGDAPAARPKLRVGYFAQHQEEELDGGESPIAHMARALPRALPPQVRAQLARFGLDADRAETPVADLSGGERARLLLALATREAPHLLILDEPTNHLDIDAREALVRALADFQGAVLLISHDPHLVELVADRLWLVADGTVRPFEGDLDDYRALIGERARPASARRRRRGGARSAAIAPRRGRRWRRCEAGRATPRPAVAARHRAGGGAAAAGRSGALCVLACRRCHRGDDAARRDRPRDRGRRSGLAGRGGGAGGGGVVLPPLHDVPSAHHSR